MDTLQQKYDYTDPNILITFVDSLYVGDYNEAPIFLKPDGDFRDFNDNKYWVTYDASTTFIPWSDYVNVIINEDSIVEQIKAKYNTYFQKNSTNLTDNMIKTICTHVLDVEIIEKMNANRNKIEKQIFVGYNRYERNYEKDVEIFIDSNGNFSDKSGKKFWPTYETIVKYRDGAPYVVYTFIPWNLVNPLEWKTPQVLQWYFNMNPRHSDWFTQSNVYIFIVLFYFAFYGLELSDMIPGVKIDLMSHYTHREFQTSTFQVPTTHHQPTITNHDTNPKFSIEKLHHDIKEKAHYQSKLDAAEKDKDTAKIDKYKADVAKYNDHEMKQLAMRDKQSDISIDQQKEMFDKKFHEHETKVYNDCKASIESFVKSGETTTTFLFGNTEKFYNVPSTISNNMTSCQKSFIQECNSVSNHCGDMGSVDGNSLKDSSSLISKAIDSVSRAHAHKEAIQYSQNVMKEFTKQYNLLDSEKAAVPELNPSIKTLPNDPLQPIIEKYEGFNKNKFWRAHNLEKTGDDAFLMLDAQYILSKNKQYVDQWTMEKEMEYRIYTIKRKKENAEYALQNNTNLSEESKKELSAKIENYEKLISVLTKNK